MKYRLRNKNQNFRKKIVMKTKWLMVDELNYKGENITINTIIYIYIKFIRNETVETVETLNS